VSRIATGTAFPWVNDRLVKRVRITFKIGIWWTLEEMGYLRPFHKGLRFAWSNAHGRCPGNREFHLLSIPQTTQEVFDQLLGCFDVLRGHVGERSRSGALAVKAFEFSRLFGVRFHAPMCARVMRDGRQLGDFVRTDLVVRVVDRWEFDVPTVAAVTAAIGDDVAGKPQCVFSCRGEEMARTTTVDADDFFGWRTCERVGEIGVRHGHFKCG